MHFTYCHPKGDLQQGDLLRIDGGVRSALQAYHPYFASHAEYAYMIVLTQSCDLDRKGKDKKCKAPYLTLAAVRPVEVAIRRELCKFQRTDFERSFSLCAEENRDWLVDFVRKLLNNNQPGYFYLAQDSEIGLPQNYVAFLMLSVPLKVEHYESCLAVRCAQLKDVFQAKLGWLVSTEYGRVGSPDWAPDYLTQQAFDRMVDEYVNQVCTWLPDRLLGKLRKNCRPVGGRDHPSESEVYDQLGRLIGEQDSRRHQAADAIVGIVLATMPSTTPDEQKKIKNAVLTSSQLSPYLK